jgi:phthalate 4,5-dioxygenase
MLTREENDLLCRVGPGTAMGNMMRRYWVPAATSEELVAGGRPRGVRLLGEDVVAFRSPDGSVGVLEEACPHRGASMILARNEDCGLRCIYHGWLIDGAGKIHEMPAEPEGSTFSDRVRARSFPAYEAGGIVWTYMGPPGTEPPKMTFDWMGYPAENRMILKAQEDCNWLQTLEGVIDSGHTMILHSNIVTPVAGEQSVIPTDQGATQRPTGDVAPRIEVDNTPYGFRYAAIRKPLIEPDKRDYVRVTHFIAPFYAMFPASAGWTSMQFFVPMDDEHTMFHFVQVQHGAALDAETCVKRARRSGMEMGVDLDERYRKIRSRENTWMQDRAAMAAGSFTGLHGVNNEDFAVQESMGPRYDRSREHLGVSDTALIRMRRMMLEAVRKFNDEGAPALGLGEPVDYERLHAYEQMVPYGRRWQDELVPA